jgi:hypothetical protein
MCAIHQVAQDEELLNIARDCSHFVTKFFEPINVSATHIYHSVLELAPLSSIIRRLYYHRRHTPFPRVAVGTPDSWDQSLALPSVDFGGGSYTWSPCSRFVAVQTGGNVEIRDTLSFELASTLQFTNPTSYFRGMLAYSPDGHSLASFSNTSLTIWDTQTGGVAKEIPCDEVSAGSLVWSLDGRTIGTVVQDREWAVHIYDIASGTRLSPGRLYSSSRPCIWACGKSLRVMTTRRGNQVHMVNIFEAGSILNKVGSFCINSGSRNPLVKLFSREDHYNIQSFSPATYHVSIQCNGGLIILDIQNSHCLLKHKNRFYSHCFSSDGSLFIASLHSSVHVWKHAFGCYTPWRKFPSSGCNSPCFSPTLSSILGGSLNTLHVWRLDGPPIAHSIHHQPLTIPSSCGTYVVIGCKGDSTITIINLLSQTPPHFVNTGMEIQTFTLTGNVLLVEDSKTIAAWKLTGEGAVEGVSGNRRAGCHNRIWAIPQPPILEFVVEDQIVTIQDGVKEKCIHIYHTGTGEVLTPTQAPLWNPHHWNSSHMHHGRHYPHNRQLSKGNICPEDNWPVSLTAFQEGWVKDPEGKCRLWIPAKWRVHGGNGTWLYNIATLNIHDNIVIKF